MTTGKLTKIIEKAFLSRNDAPRDYIGASSIGSDCMRKIWYEYTGKGGASCETKLQRTFDIGKRLEGLVIDWLKDAGLTIDTPNEQNGFFECKDSEIPVFRGHYDAYIVDCKAILEIKTANNTRFAKLLNEGLRRWSTEYYAQLQSYMGMSGINSAYILVLNKDNSAFYDEKIAFDEGFYKYLREKAKMIYHATLAPPKVHSSPLWWQCKMCKFYKGCQI